MKLELCSIVGGAIDGKVRVSLQTDDVPPVKYRVGYLRGEPEFIQRMGRGGWNFVWGDWYANSPAERLRPILVEAFKHLPADGGGDADATK